MSVLTTMAYVPITVSILLEVITVNVLLDMFFNLTIMFVKVGQSFEFDIIAIMCKDQRISQEQMLIKLILSHKCGHICSYAL